MDDVQKVTQVATMVGNSSLHTHRVSEDQDPRFKRVADYANAAIQKADPLAANLGVVNSGLFIIAARLQDAISAATDPNNPEPADLRMLQPAVDHYLRVTRQIDRFIQLELRLSEPVHGHLKGE